MNLQEHFQAVVHYDLAWNPTRHEQREGRVDRFGQRRPTSAPSPSTARTTASTASCSNVLLRKHEQIRKALGISVPVPDRSDDVVEAILEGLLLRDAPSRAAHARLRPGAARRPAQGVGQSAAAQERESRTKYAQAGIQPGEVARELAEMRASLGTAAEVAAFTAEALRALRADITPMPDGFQAATGALPAGLRDALVTGHAEPLPFHADLPVPPREAYLDRTDPNVAAIARYVLESALDPSTPGRPGLRPRGAAASCAPPPCRSGPRCCWSGTASTWSCPAATDPRQLVAEDAQVLAYRGRPASRRMALPGRGGGAARPPRPAATSRPTRPSTSPNAPSPPLTCPAPAPGHAWPTTWRSSSATTTSGSARPAASGSGARSRSAPRNPPTSSASTSTCRAVTRMSDFSSLKIVGGLLLRRPARPGLRRRPAGAGHLAGDLRPGARRVGPPPGVPLLAVPAGDLAGRGQRSASTPVRLRILLRELGFPVSRMPEHIALPGQPSAGTCSPRTTGPPNREARAPQSVMQELLNRDDTRLWGMLSNGATLRLLRDSATLVGSVLRRVRPAAIFDGELFSDFVLLYLACHESRFAIQGDGGPESCYLEQWRDRERRPGRARPRPAPQRRRAGDLDPRHRVHRPPGEPAAPGPAGPTNETAAGRPQPGRCCAWSTGCCSGSSPRTATRCSARSR